MIGSWSVMPTAVIIESSANTTSRMMIWTTAAAKVVVPTCGSPPGPPAMWWVSMVPFTRRNSPPTISTMSRQENAKPSTEATGSVSPISQVS